MIWLCIKPYTPVVYVMRRGFTLLELLWAVVIAGFVLALALPKIGGLLDSLSADAAARDVAVALAAARQFAMDRGHRVRVRLNQDSLRVDTLGEVTWGQYRAWPGAASRRASLSATTPVVTFSGLGLSWGVSNTTVTLRRGSHVETVVVSRVGRVRRG
jgi:prepilin-type N-terminal cleavage/methylation domain-containing protein